VYDIVRDAVYTASESEPLIIPEEAIVVPGSRAVSHPSGAKWDSHSKAAVIVKYRDAKTDARVQARRPLALTFPALTLFTKTGSARGSLDCPSQNIACLRTSALWFVCATSIRFGTPSSFGKLAQRKDSFFPLHRPCPGVISIAPVIVRRFLSCFWASQKSAAPHVAKLVIHRAPFESFHPARQFP